jgi:HEAT repeat protein
MTLISSAPNAPAIRPEPTLTLNALGNRDPSIRVLAIYALEQLKAKEALPALHALLHDDTRSTFGNMVEVAEAARAGIAKLEAQ